MKTITMMMALLLIAEVSWSADHAERFLGNNEDQKGMESNPVLEVALYQVKDNSHENFQEVSAEAHDYLKTFDGYLRSSRYKSILKDRYYLDIVSWESLEQAKKAQIRFESDPEVSIFLSSIEDMKFFDHVQSISEDRYHELMEGDILEFASFYIQSGSFESYVHSRDLLMDHIGTNYDDFKNVHTVRSIKEPELIIDLAHWGNYESCGVAQKEIESHQLFADFVVNFDMEKEVVMEFFKKIEE
ncbi:MAG: hypothetical protein R8G66_01555 [Cytophagales bacterium]|nr:hypothetical protein [Cytophagales bacterium]